MPEEEIQNEESQQPIEVNTDNTKSVVIVLIALSVIVMICTPIITIYAVRTMMPESKNEVKVDTSNNKEITLPVFKANIDGTMGKSFAQIEVVVEVSDPSLNVYFSEQTDDNPKGRLRKIQAAILNIISTKSLTQLSSKKAKAQLAKEIKKELNDLLKKKTKDGVVTDVYFPSFLIQT